MVAEWIKEIPTWESEYMEMRQDPNVMATLGALTSREIEILKGDNLKSNEGMIFGRMYTDWKKQKGYD